VRRPWAGKTDTRKLSNKNRYDVLEEAHQEATRRINMNRLSQGQSTIVPHQLQAITWLADKGAQQYGEGQQTKGGGRKSAQTPAGQEGMAPHTRMSKPRPARSKAAK
jgi:hypothetical protein